MEIWLVACDTRVRYTKPEPPVTHGTLDVNKATSAKVRYTEPEPPRFVSLSPNETGDVMSPTIDQKVEWFGLQSPTSERATESNIVLRSHHVPTVPTSRIAQTLISPMKKRPNPLDLLKDIEDVEPSTARPRPLSPRKAFCANLSKNLENPLDLLRDDD